MKGMNTEPRRINPFLMATAVASVAFFAHQSYRLLRPNKGRPHYKSQSRHPQIARWESEGGMVPEVRSLQSKSTQH